MQVLVLPKNSGKETIEPILQVTDRAGNTATTNFDVAIELYTPTTAPVVPMKIKRRAGWSSKPPEMVAPSIAVRFAKRGLGYER